VALEKKELKIKGMPVMMTENPGQPMLMLVRMAARQMGIWDKIWELLSRYFTIVNFDTTPADLEKFDSPAALFHHYAQQCIDVAQGLGYDKFHIFGWGGGAQVALRAIIDFPWHIESCILLGPSYLPAEKRPYEKWTDFWSVILERGDLELYTYWWLLNSFTPDYAEAHFDEIERLVNIRLQADRGRLDTKRILKWVRWLRQHPATDEELANITVPTLIVAPAFTNLSTMRKLNALIKTSQLAIVPGSGTFVLIEDPDSFMVAAGPFIRAAAKGAPHVTRLAQENNITVMSQGKRVDVLENRSDEAVVFLHGWLMSPQMWAHTMKALEGKIRCIALWQPGHGSSSAPDYEFTIDQWSDLLMGTLDSLNVKKAVLVGHSMGGMLSLHTVLKYPERVKALVLVDTQDETWDKPRNDQWVQTVDTIAASWGPGVSPQVASLLMSENFLNTHPAWLGEWTNEVAKYDLDGQRHLGRTIAHREDYSRRVNKIEIPVLVIHGTADQAITIDVARAMTERIPGARLEEIPGAGHCPPLEAPELFTEKLVGFLKRKKFIR
jgi:pimeloyl-ACP methyl ester carboxylesterase